MVFLFKWKLLKDLWLCFAVILSNIYSNGLLVRCLAACRELRVPTKKVVWLQLSTWALLS